MDIKMSQCADSEDRIRSGSSHQGLHCLSSVNGSIKEITWQSEWTCLNSRKDKSSSGPALSFVCKWFYKGNHLAE